MTRIVKFGECILIVVGFIIFFILRGAGGPRTTPDGAGGVISSRLD